MDFTTEYHLDTYSALSPKRKELSQKGRTVLITGGAGGIGLAISRAFAEAGASRLVILARRPAKLAEVKAKLTTNYGAAIEVLTYPCDIMDATATQAVWSDLHDKDVGVDVLVLNAAVANTTPAGLKEENLTAKVWATFEMNVRSSLELTDAFLKQGPSKGKVIVSVNSGAAHISPVRGMQISYAASKAGLASLLQSMADSLDPEETQIVSYAPGSVRSEAIVNAGIANAPIAWNTDTLPGTFAVWAATPEARFLHGRFVWCNWDVEELKAMGGFDHPGYCRIGLQGPKPLSGSEMFQHMTAIRQKAGQTGGDERITFMDQHQKS